MKKLKLLLGCTLLVTSISYSQNVGINETGNQADASAGLDIDFNDKGLLMPRVALTNTTTEAPVTTPATSLMVYNTANVNDVTPGYYYWDGAEWIKFGEGGNNTLDEAYDEGGAGAGRIITADAGSVEINNGGTNATALSVNSNIASSRGIDALNSNTGNAIRGHSTNAGNTFPAIQGETNSSSITTSAILGQNTGAGPGVSGQVSAGASGTAAVFGNNLRTGGGSGVRGDGFNGVVGEALSTNGYGVYGINLTPRAFVGDLSIGTYGYGFNGIYGQTTDVTNGWAGYFTANVGIEGGLIVMGNGFVNGGVAITSDKRLKKDFSDIPDALNKITQLNGKHYTISSKHRLNGGDTEVRERQEYGVIAQEVEALFPEMIKERAIFSNTGDDTSYKAVVYTQLIPVLIEGMKEQQEQIETLEQRIEALEKAINE